jgi:hypothetical protein
LSLTEALTLKEAVPFAVIGLDRCQLKCRKQLLVPGRLHSYLAEMEVTLAIWVNEELIGLPKQACEARRS